MRRSWVRRSWVMAAAGAMVFAASQIGAADFPDWAYPVTPPPGTFDAAVAKQLPGSTKQYTQAQIEDDFNPPDWFPQDHPEMPSVVANGRPPAVKACAKCHISNGAGHPESSDLAGLPANYIEREVREFQNGNRKGGRSVSMLPIAKAVSEAELAAAAQYYSALAPVAWTKVVETDTVPKSRIGTGGMRFPLGTDTEPLGNRIIELPRDPERMESRDSRVGFVAYVPVGSIARGEALVTTGEDGKTLACKTCHGADLKGKDEAPRIVGRSPMYVFRQLNDVKAGTRSGPASELMRQVVAKLEPEDMLVIAAYLATQGP